MTAFYAFPLRWLSEDESDGLTIVQLYPQLLDFWFFPSVMPLQIHADLIYLSFIILRAL